MRFRPLLASLAMLAGAAFATAADYDHEALPRDPALPTIWLIGDSTVKVSTDGQWGWGEKLPHYIDASKANVVNRAIGGRSSRTFLTEGRWEPIRERLKPGDVVIMQFGHNDSGALNEEPPGSNLPLRARGTIRGIGEESETIDNVLTGQREVVRSYGWYLRNYIADTLSQGATPLVCSLVPRKVWEDGAIRRDKDSYAGWAKSVARQAGVGFLDLNEIIARGYERLGPQTTENFFADARTHHTAAGAVFNAEAVIAALKGLPSNPLEPFLAERADAVAAYPPRSWIDPATGYRVERLSDEPGTASLYFHQNAYTEEGDLLIVTTPTGIASINLGTRENRLVVDDPEARPLLVGRQSRSVYYTLQGEDGLSAVFAAPLDGGEARKVADLPQGASVESLNADETLLLGSLAHRPVQPLAEGPADAAQDGSRPQGEWMRESRMEHPVTGRPLTFAEQKEWRMNERLEAGIPMEIFVIDTRDGRRNVVHEASDWLNHLQFSPSDPDLIMFCHEGPWHKVDRIWTIRTDGSDLRKIHARSMNMEIAGHEFFSPDGSAIWYDLQRPRGEVFWLASYHLDSGSRSWYALERDEWSVHFNIAPDASLFAGDGGDEEMVARARDGKWIFLYSPERIPDVAGISAPNADTLIRPGRLKATRLVDMRYHDYRLEPNVSFTPDGERIVFRSNMHGDTHTYAVTVR